MAESAGVFSVLRIPAFRRLWINLSLSSLGDWLGLLATTALGAALVHGYSAQAYAVGGVLIVRLLPAVLVGPLAGAFVDRFDRRWTMIVSDVARFLLYASIPIVHNLAWLLGGSFLTEVFSLFWIPAKEASVPNLVPRERLEAANQLSLISSYGSAAVAAGAFSLVALLNSAIAAAVPFFKSNPVDLALYFDAATFLFSAFTVFRIPEISRAQITEVGAEVQVGMVRSIKEGWQFIASSRWLRGLSIGIVGAVAAGAVAIGLGKLFTTELHGGNAAYGALFATLFIGLALGMFAGSRLFAGFSRRRLMGVAIVASGVALALDAVMPNLPLVVLVTLFVGAFAGVAWVTGITIVGLEVEDDRRGRTFSFIYTLIRIDMLLVLAAAPFIAGVIGRHHARLLHVNLRLDGVTLTLLGGGVLAAVSGVACYRMMDDRRGVPLLMDMVGSLAMPGRRRPGIFIAFEGIDGSGKSTQVARLADWLKASGRSVVVTREPGATALGARLRELLLLPGAVVSPRAELLLYGADRAQHVDQVICPALDKGQVVVSDRFVDSTIAYQGGGRGLPASDVSRVARWAAGGVVADLTILLDLDPKVALQRRSGPADRLEAEDLDFHTRVRQRFLDLARYRTHRYLVLDANLPEEEIEARIRERLVGILPVASEVAATGEVPAPENAR
ncbi:MAG: dTMP kinase [Mycobacteriales bacterium]